MKLLKNLFTFLFLIFCLVPVAFAGPPDIPAGSKCAECGMGVDSASPFSAMIMQGGKTFPFCDVGDMLVYYGRMEEKPSEVYVKDYMTNTWTDAMSAYYVKSASFHTPMGWGMAAFKGKDPALQAGDAMTMDEALGNVKAGTGMKHMMH